MTNPSGTGARELEGQVALVTGASRGIGRAIATALALGGARVAVVDMMSGTETAAALPGSGHQAFECDVGDPASAGKTVDAVSTALGDIAILVNNVDVKVETSPDAIRDALVRQASSPVRWVETIRAMRAEGVTHVFECGPGKALAGMVKRIDREIQTASLNDRASIEKALAQ